MFYQDGTRGFPHVQRDFSGVTAALVDMVDGERATRWEKSHRTGDIKRVVRDYAKRFDCQVSMTHRRFVLRPRSGEGWRIVIEPERAAPGVMDGDEEMVAHRRWLASR